jgi:alpha-N-arabinofuranosidase
MRFVNAFAALMSLVLFATPARAGDNLLSPVDRASENGDTDSPWETTIWTGDGRFDVVEGGKDGKKCLFMEAEGTGGDISWLQPVELEPDTEYRLAGWVKTENLKGTTGRGIVIHFDGDLRPTKVLSGTNDWTLLESTYRTTGRENRVHISLGGWGLATGRVWIDDVRVEKVGGGGEGSREKATLTVQIDAGKTGAPINPFVYGQFIEHLGRCIYGGIWAEMLEDRKFYFPITDKYDPYRDLRESNFPVVGASPWKSLDPRGRLRWSTKTRSWEYTRRRLRRAAAYARTTWGWSQARSTSAMYGSNRRENRK